MAASRWERWLRRRAPRQARVTLTHRRIYILPTLGGVGFLLVAALIAVTGVNYENNWLYALSAILLSLFVLSIWATYDNLRGLTLIAAQSDPCFAGEHTTVRVQLQRPSPIYALQLDNGEGVHLWLESVGPNSTVTLSLQAPERGYLMPARLRLSSHYPLGLFRAWSWVWLRFPGVVYPAQQVCGWPLNAELGEQGAGVLQDGEFQELRRYQQGDSLRRIAWQQLARERGLLTKSFAEPRGGSLLLSYARQQGGTEARLSQLSYLVNTADAQGLSFALELPDGNLPMGQGAEHRRRALTRLGLYGMADGEEAGDGR